MPEELDPQERQACAEVTQALPGVLAAHVEGRADDALALFESLPYVEAVDGLLELAALGLATMLRDGPDFADALRTEHGREVLARGLREQALVQAGRG